jgi:chromosome segregation ATPase
VEADLSNAQHELGPLQKDKGVVARKIKQSKKKLAQLLADASSHPSIRSKVEKLEKRKRDTNSHITSIGQQVSELQQKEQLLVEQKKNISSSIADTKDKIINKERELASGSDNLPAMKQKLALAQQKAINLEQKKEKLSVRSKKLQAQLDRLNKDRAQLTAQIKPLRQTLARLKKVITRRKQQIARVEQRDPNSPKLPELRQRLAQAEAEKSSNTSQLNDLKPKRSALVQKISQVKTDLQSVTNKKQGITQKLTLVREAAAELTHKIDNFAQSIALLKKEISQLKDQKRLKAEELQQVKSLLAAIKPSLTPLVKQLGDLKSKLRRVQAKLDTLLANPAQDPVVAAEIEQLKNRIVELSQNLELLEAKITPLLANMGQLKKKKNKIATNLSRSKTQLLNKQQKVRLTQVALKKSQEQISKLASLIATSEEKLARSQKRVSKVTGSLVSLRSQLPNAKEQLELATSKVQKVRERLKKLKGKLQDVKIIIAQKKEKLEQASRRYSSIASRLPRLRRFMKDSRQTIDRNLLEISSNSDKLKRIAELLDRMSADLNYQANSRSRLEGELEDQRVLISEDQRQYDSQTAMVYQQKAIIRDLSANVEQKKSHAERNQSTIHYNENKIVELGDENIELTHEIAELNTAIPKLEQQSVLVWSNFRRVDSAAVELEADTQEKLDKLNETKTLYLTQQRAAIASGDAQGEPLGELEGSQMGSKKGLLTGQTDGAVLGSKIGMLTGLKKSLLVGMNDGKAKGYQNGLNAPENYQEGFDQGYTQGENDALAEAIESSYPKGRSDKKNEILSHHPTSIVEFSNNGGSKSFVVNSSDYIAHPFLAVESTMIKIINNSQVELDGDETEAEISVKQRVSSLDEQITNLHKAYEGSMRDAGRDITIDVQPSEELAECSRGYDLFNQNCLDAFKASFISQYRQNYRESFKAEYLENIQVSYQQNFDLHHNDQAAQGYQEAYNPVFSAWDSIGAEEAVGLGYVDGKVKGHSENIEKFKSVQYQKGQHDEQSFFRLNPVLRIADFKIIASEENYFPGAQLTVELSALNFGGKASSRGQIRVSAASIHGNIQINNQGAIPIQGFAGETKAIISDVLTMRINDDVREGDPLGLSLTATLPNGQSVVKVIELKAQQHIAADLKIRGDSTPKICGFLCVRKKHTVKVDINNLSRTILDQPFKVVISSNKPGIKFEDSVKLLNFPKESRPISS